MPSSASRSAQQALLRAARLEAGLFTTALNAACDCLGTPITLMNPELAGGDIEITRAQNRNYLLGEGFHQMASKSNSWSLFLRYQAQAERHYRRAVEEFERLKSLRAELPDELPNEAISEAQPEQKETTCAPDETNPSPPEKPQNGDRRQFPPSESDSGTRICPPSAPRNRSKRSPGESRGAASDKRPPTSAGIDRGGRLNP